MPLGRQVSWAKRLVQLEAKKTVSTRAVTILIKESSGQNQERELKIMVYAQNKKPGRNASARFKIG